MKNLKKVMTLVMTLALVAGFVQVPVVKAEAAEPTTWYITYDKGTKDWYGSMDNYNWSFPDLTNFKAGDNLIINADGEYLDQYTVRCPQAINELSIIGGSNVIVYAPYVEHAVSVTSSTGVIHSNVGKVDAYYSGVIQVEGNVGWLVANYTYEENEMVIFGVTGTVDKANCKYTGNLINNTTTIYNVAKGKLVTNDRGFVPLNEGEYSLVPTGSTTVAAPAAGQAAAGSNGKQLDAVPKTGAMGVSESAIFFGLAAVFAIGAVVYKKKAHN